MAERVSPTPATTANSAPRKPRFALAIATAFGLGYLPKAPGTFGSLAAIPLYLSVYGFVFLDYFPTDFIAGRRDRTMDVLSAIASAAVVSLLLATVGVWASGRAAIFSGRKDPQFVVIDEVSGQYLALLLGSLLPLHSVAMQARWPDYPFARGFSAFAFYSVANWKFLLAGFILFRVFDIWKPFPARQAESLPGGWGIMADDWVAAVYAALGLWLLRALGL